MTNQDYARFTNTAHMGIYTTASHASAISNNKHNLGKTKVVKLACGRYGVAQHKIANKFIAAGYSHVWLRLNGTIQEGK